MNSEQLNKEIQKESIKFGFWILKELQDNDPLHAKKWDFNGDLLTTKQLYEKFKQKKQTICKN